MGTNVTPRGNEEISSWAGPRRAVFTLALREMKMPSFLLVTVPFLNPYTYYYPASYVASIIKKAGWTCHYIDFNMELFPFAPDELREPWKHEVMAELFKPQSSLTLFGKTEGYISNRLARIISDHDVSLIGLSLYSSSKNFALLLTKLCKRLFPHIPIMFGGADCFPHMHCAGYFSEPVAPDILLQGEAELALPRFLEEFAGNGEIRPSIPGFLYLRDATLIDTGLPDKPSLRSMDIIADNSVYQDVPPPTTQLLTTFTSKGCINKCAFCNEWIGFRPHRRRNPRLVVNEIHDMFTRHGQWSSLWLLDSNFNTSEKYVREFCRELLSADMGLTWKAMGCFRVELSDDTLDLLKRSGLVELMLGLESASQSVLDYMNKNYNINNAQRILDTLSRHGIRSRLPVMNGFPGESNVDFLVTAAFILRHGATASVSFSYSNICGIYQHSFLHKHPDDFLIDPADLSANNWRLLDGCNTLPVRCFRSYINMMLIQSAVTRSFDGISALKALDFNSLDVATEAALTIYQLSQLNDVEEKALDLLRLAWADFNTLQVDEKQASRLDFLKGVIPCFSLETWLTADKTPDIIDKILQFIVEQFKFLSQRLTTPTYIDFIAFKDALFRLENFRHRQSPTLNLVLTDSRETRSDNGKFVILEGRALDQSFEYVHKILVKSDEGYTEFHYGIDSGGRSGQYATQPYCGFWGKVRKSVYQSDQAELLILYRDQTYDAMSLGAIKAALTDAEAYVVPRT